IVVIESGVTTKAQLREVSKTLQRLDVSSVGFVLNRISLKNANPAFRHSVGAVETHLLSQARAFERVEPKPETPPHPKPAPAPAPPEVFERLWNMVSEPASPAVPAQLTKPAAEAQPHQTPVSAEPIKSTAAVQPPTAPEPPRPAPEVKAPEVKAPEV